MEVEDQAIYDQISPSLVKFVFKQGQEEWMLPGIIASSGDDYCYAIANFSPKFQPFLSEAILPDGTNIKLKKEDIDIRFGLMTCYIQTSARMEAVNLSENVSMNEEVRTFVFEGRLVLPLCHMSSGRVTHQRDFEFSHDSSSGPLTPYGGIVFNKQAEFIGICFKDRGVTVAHNVFFIRRTLALHHGMNKDTPLPEVLHHIGGLARSRKNKRTQAVSKRKTDGNDQAKSSKKRKKKSR